MPRRTRSLAPRTRAAGESAANAPAAAVLPRKSLRSIIASPSEHQPESEAHRPLAARDRTRDLPEGRSQERAVGVVEVRRIGDVEDIGAHFAFRAADREHL